MIEPAIGAYVDSFCRQLAAAAGVRDQMLDEPGLVGLLRDRPRRVRLLVLDDRPLSRLRHLLDDEPSGVIDVFQAASSSAEMLDAVGGWSAKTVEVMVSRDLSETPAFELPDGLVLEEIQVVGDDTPGKVDLLSAATFVVGADPTVTESAEQLATNLRKRAPQPSLFAAVDAQGAIRATSGYRVTATDATILFVNTDQAWRRRGIGRAMTAAALRAAHDAGATVACLEARDVAATIYRSLGFENAGLATQFSRMV